MMKAATTSQASPIHAMRILSHDSYAAFLL